MKAKNSAVTEAQPHKPPLEKADQGLGHTKFNAGTANHTD